MAEDLQGLLEKINREGIEKANAEAAKIIAEAQTRAAKIVAEAEEKASRITSESEAAAKDRFARAETSIAQAARDVLLKLKGSIAELFQALLVTGVEKGFDDASEVAALALEAAKSVAAGGEIVCGERLARSLKSHLAASGEFTVVLDPDLGSGFTVKTENGRVEHSFTSEMIADELGKRLRPEIRKLLK